MADQVTNRWTHGSPALSTGHKMHTCGKTICGDAVEGINQVVKVGSYGVPTINDEERVPIVRFVNETEDFINDALDFFWIITVRHPSNVWNPRECG